MHFTRNTNVLEFPLITQLASRVSPMHMNPSEPSSFTKTVLLRENGGEMAALIAAFDWSGTSLGSICDWPQSLRTTVSIMLHSPVPMVLLWGRDGVMIYNDAYAVIAAANHPRLVGSPVLEGWTEIAAFNANVMRIGMNGGTLSYRDKELTLYRSGSAEQVWMNLDYSPVLDETGDPGGVLCVVNETTDRVLANRRIGREGERLREMFQQAPGFMALLQGPEHVFEIINDAYLQLVGHRRDLIGKSVQQALPEIEGQGFLELLNKVFSTAEPFIGRNMPVTLQRQRDSALEKRFIDLVYQPITDSDGSVTGIFVEGHDVTERIQAEDTQKLLMREMDHRVKNLFAITSGMVTMSARSANSPQEMARTLRGRIEALARANNLINPEAVGSGEDTTLETLIRTILEPHSREATLETADGIALSGPPLAISGDAVTSMCLVLHELGTNSVKYGALSTDTGSIRIEWEQRDEELCLEWTEIAGPAISNPPQATGFGSILVKRSVMGQLGGRIEFDWRTEGLSVRMAIPLGRIVA